MGIYESDISNLLLFINWERAMVGILAAIGAAALFTTMDVFVRFLGHMDTGEITFWRGLLGLLLLPVLARKVSMPVFSGKHRVILHLRGIFGGAGIFLFFLSLKGLTLGDAEILAQLAAFFMCFLSPIFLKGKLSHAVVPGLLIITVGTAFVIQIWNFESFNEYALLGIVSAFFSACAYIAIGMLTDRGGHSGIEIVFYFQLYSMIIGAAMMPAHFLWPSGFDWLWIIGMSAAALFAQMMLTWACQHVHSLIVSFAMYTGVLFHVFCGWLFWGELLTIWSWIGGALIIVGSGALLLAGREK